MATTVGVIPFWKNGIATIECWVIVICYLLFVIRYSLKIDYSRVLSWYINVGAAHCAPT
jgi:hypothetical protein